ncbi:MAG: hypothetical protein AAGE52_30940 [Myxococcota bacterium]
MKRGVFSLFLFLLAACSSSGSKSPEDAVRALASAMERKDEEAIVAAFHPAVREAVQSELARAQGNSRNEAIGACLRRSLEVGELEDAPDVDRIDGAKRLVVEGQRDTMVLAPDDDEWFVIDSGC